jgi:hypothetical protein
VLDINTPGPPMPTDIRDDLARHFSQLVAIHAAPRWLWSALVAAMLAKGWKSGPRAAPAANPASRNRRRWRSDGGLGLIRAHVL